MNQPTMTNEQFALWFANTIQGKMTTLEKAQIVLDWINKNEKRETKPLKQVMPK